MAEDGRDRAGRSRKRFLTPLEKYETWVQLLRHEATIAEAADRSGVDRSTIMKLRTVAKQGALDALAASRPGIRPSGPDPELAEARAEIERLGEALKEMGVRLAVDRPGLPVPGSPTAAPSHDRDRVAVRHGWERGSVTWADAGCQSSRPRGPGGGSRTRRRQTVGRFPETPCRKVPQLAET